MNEDIDPGGEGKSTAEPAYTIATWSTEQAIAVYEFCTLVQDALWQRHAEALFDHLHGRGEVDGPLSPEDIEHALQMHLRLEPMFDDDLPF